MIQHNEDMIWPWLCLNSMTLRCILADQIERGQPVTTHYIFQSEELPADAEIVHCHYDGEMWIWFKGHAPILVEDAPSRFDGSVWSLMGIMEQERTPNPEPWICNETGEFPETWTRTRYEIREEVDRARKAARAATNKGGK